MSEKIELRLLGYPQILKNDAVVSGFISNKALLLFCFLVLERQTHTRDALSTLLWGEMPEQRAKANLRQALHNIQKLFPDCFDVSRQAVAVRDVSQIWIDVVELRNINRMDAPSSLELERAYALYNGEFLEGINATDDFQLDDWLRGHREGCRIAHMTLLEKLEQHYVAAGLWEKAENTLRTLIQIEPWKESYYRHLMICLARQSEFTAAILQYETCQQMLMDEFGEEPAYETRRIYERILAARSRRFHKFPAQPGECFGRSDEVRKLEQWLLDSQSRLITITGQGGIGKTHLAQHLTSRNEMLFLNGVIFVALHSIVSEPRLIAAICDPLELPTQRGEDMLEPLTTYLKDVELLIVLDNFEQLLSCVHILEHILKETADITLLVTSRERLRLRQEHVLELEGLPVPHMDNCLMRVQRDYSRNGHGRFSRNT